MTAAAQRLQAKVVEWRRDFHQHPELSNREARTSAEVAKRLRAMGLKPKTGIAHHGVVAIIEGGKPAEDRAARGHGRLAGDRADGLPFASKATDQYRGQTVGVMHACGHDAHTATLLGVAEALVSMKKDLPGQVMLIFQPAEEGPAAGRGWRRTHAEGRPVCRFQAGGGVRPARVLQRAGGADRRAAAR